MKKVKGKGQVKTPQSAPPVKRKKLAQEIDEELSDVDFDVRGFLWHQHFWAHAIIITSNVLQAYKTV